jgi:hypothetical protein
MHNSEKSEEREKMAKHKIKLLPMVYLKGPFIVALHCCLVFAVSPLMAQNPTPQEIADAWDTFSDGQAGKVVYGNRDDDKIYVIDLATGEAEPIADLEESVPNNPNWAWGGCFYLKWSPDGNRISFQNNAKLMVMNADGSNQQVIATMDLGNPDNIRSGWDGNDKIAYTDRTRILRIAVNPDNTAGDTEILFDEQEPAAAGFTSVGISGDFVCWMDLRGNVLTGGGHRDLLLNWKTGEIKDMVPRWSDGCQYIIKPDSSGAVMYCNNNHEDPAIVVSYDIDATDPDWKTTYVIDQLPPVEDPEGAFHIQQMTWSNDLNYVMHMGKSQNPDHAWIRKMDDKLALYLGDYIDWPDLYFGEPVVDVRKPLAPHDKVKKVNIKKLTPEVLQVQVNIDGNYNIILYDTEGTLLFERSVQGKDAYTVSLSHLNPGIYFIKLKTSGGAGLYKTMVLVN